MWKTLQRYEIKAIYENYLQMSEKRLKITDFGGYTETAKVFSCTQRTVRNALLGKCNSEKSVRIRKYVKQKYTVIEF